MIAAPRFFGRACLAVLLCLVPAGLVAAPAPNPPSQPDAEPLSDGWLIGPTTDAVPGRQIRYRPADPVRAARAAIAAGDARPVLLPYWGASGIACFFRVKEGTAQARHGARPLADAMGNPILAQQKPAPGQRARSDRVREWFATEYNRIVVASPTFPYRDVCTNVRADRGLVAQRLGLAPHPPRDDGTLTGAIRLGRLDLFRQRLASDPASAGRPDPDFGVGPILWAFAAGRMDMIEALIAAGADPAHHPDYQLFSSTLAWGRRDAALWLIDHARNWQALRGGDDVLDVTVEALGPDVAFHILNKFSAADPPAMEEMAGAGMNSRFRTKHRDFWLSLLTDKRWSALCAQSRDRCEQFARDVVFQGSDEEVRAFFTHGWLPPPSAIAGFMQAMARQLNAARIALLATFPYDRREIAFTTLPPPPPPPIFMPVEPETDELVIRAPRAGERPDTPAERQAAANEAQERRQKLAATIAILLKIGVPAESLRR